jgi:hypothetical protein
MSQVTAAVCLDCGHWNKGMKQRGRPRIKSCEQALELRHLLATMENEIQPCPQMGCQWESWHLGLPFPRLGVWTVNALHLGTLEAEVLLSYS